MRQVWDALGGVSVGFDAHPNFLAVGSREGPVRSGVLRWLLDDANDVLLPFDQ